MLIEKAENYRDSIVQLLSAAKLPVEDLPLSLDNFSVALNNKNGVIGVVGLEIYGNYALLRSLAVEPEYRGRGVANKLLGIAEGSALLNNVKAIYLITETTSVYFSQKGYITVARIEVPDEIKVSSEFSYVCPVSAIVMKKELN
jgi:amino-acid N-acetyltransferase